MKIVRGTVQQWTSLDKIKETLTKKGFSDFEDEEEGFLVTIADNDEIGKEFLKVIVVDDDVSKYYKHLEGASGTAIEYLLLIDGFSEFLFVRQNITTLGKRRIEKFKFYRDDPKRSSLEKLNSLEFDNIESFEELFDTRAVVNEFYDEYKKKRTKLLSKIQGIKDKTDREKYAQVIFDRLIFLHFIQQKKFLCDDPRFLLNKYEEVKKDKKNYYEDFLKFLFFDLLNTPDNKRDLRHAEFFEVPFLNGGLFREHRIEEENPKIWIGNDIIEEILYFLGDWYWYVDESSDFGEDKALSPEILGHIFEKTITGQKEKGAYYTPEQITRYISENTVFPYCVDKINEQFKKKYENINEILKKKNTKEISYLYFEVLKKMSVLDNAVGSGAFLLAAQKVLLELYKQCWEIISNENTSEVRKENNDIDKHKTPEYHFKKWIISHNVYGVDIEEGAIEICKLRLWLSLVSEFTKETIEPLPNVDYNVMCGNSLVGYIEPPKEEQVTLQDGRRMSDILKEIHKLKEEFSQEEDPDRVKELKNEIDSVIEKQNENLNDSLFGELTHKGVKINRNDFDKLNPFHWGLKFYEKFVSGGFDVIVGNPPYVRHEKIKELKPILEKTYFVYTGTADLYTYFYERSIKSLNENGYLSYISSNKWMKVKYGYNMRKFLKGYKIIQLVDFFELKLFADASTEPIIVILNKFQCENNSIKFSLIDKLQLTDFDNYVKTNEEEIQKEHLKDTGWNLSHSESRVIIDKMRVNSIPLGDLVREKIYSGIKTGANDIFVINQELYKKLVGDDASSKKIIRPLIEGVEIDAFSYNEPNRYLIVVKEGTNINQYPAIKKYLLQHKERLSNRSDIKGKGQWFELRKCSYYKEFSNEKIVYIHTARDHKFAVDKNGYFLINNCYFIVSNNKYLLCFLNSKLFEYFKRYMFVSFGDPRSKGRCKLDYNKMVDVPVLDIDKKQEKIFQEISEKITSLKVANRDEEETNKEMQKMNQEMYKLYNLTPEEINIVEESVSNG